MSYIKPFKFWCQRVLPLVYDDSLSYYEVLCKVVDYLNHVIDDFNSMSTEFTELEALFNQLKSYVDSYFNNLNVQDEINKKLDAMAADGTFTKLLEPYLVKYQKDLNKLQSSITGVQNNLSKTNQRIDSLVVGSGDAEVTNAKSDAYGNTYNILSERLTMPEDGLKDFCMYRSFALYDGFIPLNATSMTSPDPTKTRYCTNIIKVPHNGFMLCDVGDNYLYRADFFLLGQGGMYVKHPDIISLGYSNKTCFFPDLDDTLYVAITFKTRDGATEWFHGVLPCNFISPSENAYCILNSHTLTSPYNQRVNADGSVSQGYGMITYILDKSMVDFVISYDPFVVAVGLRDENNNLFHVICPPERSDNIFSGYNAVQVPDIYNGTKVASVYITVSQCIFQENRRYYMNFDTYIHELKKKLLIFPKQVPVLNKREWNWNTVARRNRGLQLQNLTFTPKSNTFPMASNIEAFFNTYKWRGIPYSGRWAGPFIIPWHVTPYTFITATQNINSRLYTYVGSLPSVRPYYGIACSGFVSYCLDTPMPIGNNTLMYEFEKYGYTREENNNHTFFTMQPGDVVLHYDDPEENHCAMVYDMTYRDGQLWSVTLLHGNWPVVNFLTYDFDRVTYNSFFNTYQWIYRRDVRAQYTKSPELPIPGMEDYVPTPSTNLMLCKGDKAIYDENNNIELTIIPETANNINVYLNGSLYKTLGITSLNPVVKNNLRTIQLKEQLEEDGIYTFTSDASEEIATLQRRTRPTLTIQGRDVTVPVVDGLSPWYIQLTCGDDAIEPYQGGYSFQILLTEDNFTNNTFTIPEEYGMPKTFYVVFKDTFGATFSHNLFGPDYGRDE